MEPKAKALNVLARAAMTTGQETTDRRRVVQRPGALISGHGLTRSQRREIERRKKLMEAYYALLEKGLTKEAAVKELGLSMTTVWRWHVRIEPLTPNCGRKTNLENFNPPAAILNKIRKLQLAGMSNADAWHEIAKDSRCPVQLREHLRKTTNVSPSLLAATKLKKRKADVIEGPDFSVIQKS